jgi:hypothetical protein
MTTLDISRIVDVSVEVSGTAATRRAFNQGLIIGYTAVIPASERLRQYTSIDDMLTDGFISTDPEYLAATLYFSASSDPNYVWIGRQDLTSAKTIAVNTGGTGYNVNDILTIVQSGASGGTATVTAIIDGAISALSVAAIGSGYDVGDVLTVVQSGASGGTATVTSVNGSGGVTGITLTTGGSLYDLGTGLSTTVSPSGGTGCTITITAIEDGTVSTLSLTTVGTGYSVSTGLATTVVPTGGTSCTIDISAIGDTALASVQACRAKTTEWYCFTVCGAAKADHIAIAAYVEAATPSSFYFYTTQDADAPTNGTGNIFSTLKALNYSRTLGQYSSSNAYAISSIMGYAMGENSGLANSAFTLMFKEETGVTVEDLTTTQVNNIENNYGNLYVSYGTDYELFEKGTCASGSFFDQILGRDMLTNDIQQNVLDLLKASNKVTQTDAGVTKIISAVNEACSTAANIGYIGAGTWTGPTVLNLTKGDTLSVGYLVQAESLASQSTADRAARKSPNIYVAIKEAGAIHSVLIGVYVNV